MKNKKYLFLNFYFKSKFVLLVYSNLCSNIDCWIQDFWQRFRIGVNRLENSNAVFKALFPVKSFNKDIVLIIIDDKSVLGVKGLFENDRSVYAKALLNLKIGRASCRERV